MRLAAYLARERLTYSAFANQIGSRHARTVQRYAIGAQTPNARMMSAIIQVTRGEVTPNDFYEPEPSAHALDSIGKIQVGHRTPSQKPIPAHD